MICFPVLAIVLAAGAAAGPSLTQPAIDADRRMLAELATRLHTYVELKAAAATPTLPLVVLPDPGEVRRRSDALATVIKSARWGARQGDIFTPEIAQLIRRAVRGGCDGDYASLFALMAGEGDVDVPLPVPAVHERWPAGAPLPTMPPDLLAALPPLPPGLQYRFMGIALVLLDIDANLIIDFVPDVMPLTTLAPVPSLDLSLRGN